MAPSWFPLFTPRKSTLSDEASYSLLPTNGRSEGDRELERLSNSERRGLKERFRTSLSPRFLLLVIAVFGVLTVLASFLWKTEKPEVDYLEPPRELPQEGPFADGIISTVYEYIHDNWDPSASPIDVLYAHQSSTLEQAMARYYIRNGRPPPPNYDQWYEYARKHSCLIDEYEQISRDFEPFYQLNQQDPAFFEKMVEMASANIQSHGDRGITTGKFEGGAFSYTDHHGTMYSTNWPVTFGKFGHFMPDMNIILNGRDEPRIVFNYRKIEDGPGIEGALNASDPDPFGHSPHPTYSFYKDEMGCTIPTRPKGFTGAANDASAFMMYSSSTQFSLDLVPILSVTKISPCFADIVAPSEYYNSRSDKWPRYAYPDNVDWNDKLSKIYWRGSTTGGHIDGDNYHSFPRFRVIDIGRKHPDLMDVRIVVFQTYLCDANCNAGEIIKEYGIDGHSSPREEVYKFKYVLDLDGNSFSGRYFGLLRSGSLVFKATVFTEHFNDWLRPFVHYIPVLPDLSDLVDKINWANSHQDEARTIQQAGKAFTERVLTDAQNDCYFSLELLEWARLQNMAKASEVPETTDSAAGATD